MSSKIAIRDFQPGDARHIVGYFVDAEVDYLLDMGADPNKLPSREDWTTKLLEEFDKPIQEKEYFYVIWLIDGKAVGHSNINNIRFGLSATMHLHIWQAENRKRGSGLQFLRLTIPQYFHRFLLQTLICEPFAGNPAPNRILPQVGFDLAKTYETTPGVINLLQTVNRYEMTRERFDKLWPGDTPSDQT